ncbi:13335_t:CDS:1, partial [Racocetra persica]
AMIGVMNLKEASFQSIVILPLPFLTILFKVICHRKFDQKIHYYTPREAFLESCKTNESKDLDHLREKVSTRFGHPSLTAEIITPMVHSNAKDALSKVYRGRVNETKENQRGTVKSMSMFIDGNNALKIQTVEESELEVDEDAYLDEQNPGYYINYDEPQFDSLPQNQQPSASTGYDTSSSTGYEGYEGYDAYNSSSTGYDAYHSSSTGYDAYHSSSTGYDTYYSPPPYAK